MKCKFCGSTRFIGRQVRRMDVLVGEDGSFLANFPGASEPNIYNSECPYGPFICQGCGADYETLQDGEASIYGPIKDWQSVPFRKTLDFMRGEMERCQQWEGAYYELSISFCEAGLTTIRVHKKPQASQYLPVLYVGNGADNLPTSVFIKTTSYGTLVTGEAEKLCAALRIAFETARIVELQFIQTIRSGDFHKGDFISHSNAPSGVYGLPSGLLPQD